MSENKLGIMPVKRLVVSMSLPIMISMVVQALYNIVDSIFVAQISEQALAAVSFAFPIQMIIVSVSVGTGVGINSLMSRCLGEGDLKKANAVAMNGVFLGLASWLVFVLFGFFGSRWFMTLFAADPELITMGTQYISICCVFSVGVFIQLVMERIMQATGNPVYHMILQGLGAVTNIILDPILIFGWFGLPALGVAGAAIATVIGQIVAMVCGIVLTQKKVREIQLSFRGFRPDRAIIGRIYSVGVPAMFIQGMMAVMMLGMNTILVRFSDLAVSVFGIYYKLQNFMFMAVGGMNNALIPIVAFNYGARNGERMRQAIRFSLLLGCGVMLCGTVVFQLFPRQLLLLFNANEQMLKLGIPALRVISLSFVFAGISMLLCAAFQAVGNGVKSLVITLGRQLVIVLPLAWGLAVWKGLDATWYAFLIAEAVCAAASLLMMKSVSNRYIRPCLGAAAPEADAAGVDAYSEKKEDVR